MKRLPVILLGVYLAVFAVCAVSPYDRTVWLAENLPIVLLVALMAWVHRQHHAFSAPALLLATVLPVLHTIGGHYTFERVPFGWVSDLFGFERNHYDRLAHFSVGFYAYALAEGLEVKALVRGRGLAMGMAVTAILALAGAYEIFEWLYALSADPAAGIAVLGSQGDVWDAQKDMLADTLGALAAVLIYAVLARRQAPGVTG